MRQGLTRGPLSDIAPRGCVRPRKRAPRRPLSAARSQTLGPRERFRLARSFGMDPGKWQNAPPCAPGAAIRRNMGGINTINTLIFTSVERTPRTPRGKPPLAPALPDQAAIRPPCAKEVVSALRCHRSAPIRKRFCADVSLQGHSATWIVCRIKDFSSPANRSANVTRRLTHTPLSAAACLSPTRIDRSPVI